MKNKLSYRFKKPPRAIRKATLDNIALVPASLLPLKGTYQPLANTLPQGSILICQTSKHQRIKAILAKVAAFFRSHGHQVTTLPVSQLCTSGTG
jgi:hypothetical protein